MRVEVQGDISPEVVAKFEVAVLHMDMVWTNLLKEHRGLYFYPPRVVLYLGGVNTECGQGLIHHGPFYCSSDRSVYIDPRWFERLVDEYGARAGEFSALFILAHEIGHHIQELTGIFHRILSAPGDQSMRVRGELEADFLAGIWTRHAADDPEFPWTIKEEDLDIALSVAKAVGDDTVQTRKSGAIDNSRWGHGSAEQRQLYFLHGYLSKDFMSCNLWTNPDINNLPSL